MRRVLSALLVVMVVVAQPCYAWADGYGMRVTNIVVPDSVPVIGSFTVEVSAEWSDVGMFQPPPYVLRVEICEGSPSDISACRALAFGPSGGENVASSGSKTYGIELTAPSRAGVWHLTAIVELRACFMTHVSLQAIQRGDCFVAIDWGGVKPWQGFDVQVIDRASLIVDTEPSIPGVPISVDGSPTYTDASGMIRTEIAVTDSHTVEVPGEVMVGYGMKMVFVSWSDALASNSRTVLLTGDATLTAKYKRQYLLTVDSEVGSSKGMGWYDDGSIAMFSVESPLSADGLMGVLGGKVVFAGWMGDSGATSAAASVTMDGPKTVRAVWETDYTTPYTIIGATIATLAVIAVLLAIRRIGMRVATKTALWDGGDSKLCTQCNAENPSSFNYCGKCGAKLDGK
jgi:uncharacterized repeat protein (TIGR02543 family)